MGKPGIVQLTIALGLTGLLAACEPTTGADSATPAGAAGSARAIPGTHDVEAPGVFSVSDTGLWDGRPSLGGVWVADARAKDPERVLIRNLDTGKTVVGALFRRERDMPGPRVQVSSDAAQALGMLAGAPAKVSVVALKRQEPAAAKPAAATTAVATAAAKPAATPATPTPAPAAKTKTDPAPKAVAALAPVKAAPSPGPAPSVPRQSGRTQPTTAQAAPTPPAATAPAAATPTAGTSFIQVGSFGVEQNATSAVARLTAAGITAGARATQTRGRTVWNVATVATDISTLQSQLPKIRSLGFRDAFIVKK